jgi:hypothetical protein
MIPLDHDAGTKGVLFFLFLLQADIKFAGNKKGQAPTTELIHPQCDQIGRNLAIWANPKKIHANLSQHKGHKYGIL